MNRMPDPADSLTPATPSDAGLSSRPATANAAHDAARVAADAAVGAGPADRGAGAADGATDAGRTAIGVAGGAAAGTMAGLQAGALAGAVTLGVGAVAGAVMGAAAGAALAQDADPSRYTPEVDAHYRTLYEGAYPGADAAGGYAAARPAYVFGHVAASEPALAGRTFDEAEPALGRAWEDELRPRAAGAAAWADVRRYVRDAFGHARAAGVGERRAPGVVGSGGSAVDPVELDRALHGLPSTGA